jgi:hypothetical protein
MKTFLNSIKPIAIAVLATLSLSAWANGGSTGGGNVVVQPDGSVRFLDLMKTPTRELFDPRLTDGFDEWTQVMNGIPAFKQTTYIPTRYDQSSALVSDKLISALDSLTFYKVPGPLPELNDQGIILFEIQFQGQVKRLAAQSIELKTVLVDRDLFEKMSQHPRDVGAFYFHEAAIRAYYDNVISRPLGSTERIGNLVHVVFDPKTAAKITPRILARYLNDTGIAAAAGVFLGYELKSGMATSEVVFNDFLVFNREDQSIHSFSGNGARYQQVGCSGNCTLWHANVVEHAEGKDWKAQISLVLHRYLDIFDMLEIGSSYNHFSVILDSWDDDSAVFLEKR